MLFGFTLTFPFKPAAKPFYLASFPFWCFSSSTHTAVVLTSPIAINIFAFAGSARAGGGPTLKVLQIGGV